MTIAFACPNCATTFRVDAAHVGKKARCKHCQQVSTIAVGSDSYDVEEAAPPPPPPMLPINVAPDAPFVDGDPDEPATPEPVRHVLSVAPGEPWFYRYLAMYAGVIIGLGLLQFVMLFFVGLASITDPPKKSQQE